MEMKSKSKQLLSDIYSKWYLGTIADNSIELYISPVVSTKIFATDIATHCYRRLKPTFMLKLRPSDKTETSAIGAQVDHLCSYEDWFRELITKGNTKYNGQRYYLSLKGN